MKLLLWGIFICHSLLGYACDGCNVYTGMSAYDTKNKIGIYARQRVTYGTFSALGEMITKHTGHADDQNLWDRAVKELYQTYEIRGTFYIKSKWKTTVVIPFTNNYQFLDGEKRFRINGLSDPILLETFNLKFDKNPRLKQKLGIGLGVKIPLGLTQVTVEGHRPNLDFQPGSGAYSGLAYLDYYISNDKWGGFGNVNYKLNGKNQTGYQYGYSLNSKLSLFRKATLGKASFIYMAGLYSEITGLDRSIQVHDDTGGEIWFGNVEVRCSLGQLMLSAEYQPVLNQRLNGTTQLLTKHRTNIGLTYNLK